MKEYCFNGDRLWPPPEEYSALSKAEFPIKEEEFRLRISRTKAAISAKGLDAMVLFGDGYRPGNLRYLVNYLPPSSWRVGIVLMPSIGEDTLFIDRPIEWWVKERAYVDDVRCSIVQWHGDNRHVHNLVECIKDKKLDKGRIGITGMDIMPASFFMKIKEELPQAIIYDATSIIEDLKIIKSPAEIALIEIACRIGGAAMESAIDAIKEGVKESEVALIAENTAINLGADSWGWLQFFNVISGKETSLPVMRQPLATRKKIKQGDLVIVDLAIFYQGYCCDFNRMAIVGGPTVEQQRMFDVSLEMEQSVIKMIKPGVLAKDLFNHSKQIAIDAGYGNYAPEVHAGHGIGLEVGELPMITPYAETVLQPGMVIAVEPGLGIPGKEGYRTEDNIVVTDTGCRILTTIPRKLYCR